MTIKHDIQANLKDAVLTKIEGQPRTETLNTLWREISEILVDIETTNGGGEHGHLGMIMSDTEYVVISKGGERWTVPTNPGPYPTSVNASTSDFDREKAVAEHKFEIQEYETYQGVEKAIREKILGAIDSEYVESLRDEKL